MMGYDDESLMLQAAKFGQLSMGGGDNFRLMTVNCFDQLLSYLRSQLSFKQVVSEKRYHEMHKISEQFTVRDKLRTYNREKVLFI